MERKLVVAQLGARQRYQIPIAFNKINWLAGFITDYWNPFNRKGKLIEHLTTNPLIDRSLDRWSRELIPDTVHSHNILGIKMALDLQHNQDPIKRSHIITKYGGLFANSAVRDLKKLEHNCYFGFCSEALEALLYEEKTGNFTFLDQYDCGNDEGLIDAELERWPGWKPSFRRTREYYERVYKEWELANAIIVNSVWTKENIIKQGARSEKIFVIPQIYNTKLHNISKTNKSGTFKVLYVGGVNIRKGVQYLIEAAKYLTSLKIQFTIIGEPEVSEDVIASFPPNILLTGHLSHDKLKDFYLQSDVFVFPTLSDGFGRVQLEAMEYGLPVISTPNCGEVVNDMKNGVVVPARNSMAIAEAITKLYLNKDLLFYLSEEASKTPNKYSESNFVSSIENIIATYIK